MRTVISLIVFACLISLHLCILSEEKYLELKSKVQFETLDFEEVGKVFEGVDRDQYISWRGYNHLVDMEKVEEEIHKSHFEKLNFLADGDPVLKQALPLEFDWRNIMPQCFTPIKHQRNCGCCYSFAVTAALESRFCIHSKGALRPELSQQDIISCDDNNMKCKGDYLHNTWGYLEKRGTCDYQCKPYASFNGDVPKCTPYCSDPNSKLKYWRITAGSFKYLNDAYMIQREIYYNGPVTAGMQTFEDFIIYKGGIYIHTAGAQTDYHAISIVGWGYDRYYNRNYWIVRNSWGKDWGENGYFKILWGYYQIDSYVMSGIPLIE